MLFDSARRPERDYVQAVAWFELAAEQGVPQAREVATAEAARLTPGQTRLLTTLKGQLVNQ
jgi:TPR repeat protein